MESSRHYYVIRLKVIEISTGKCDFVPDYSFKGIKLGVVRMFFDYDEAVNWAVKEVDIYTKADPNPNERSYIWEIGKGIWESHT